MALIVYINGVDKTSNVSKNSFRISRKVGNQSTLDISFNCYFSSWMPQLGQDIKAYDGATLLFGGVISRLSKQELEPNRSSNAYVQVQVNSNGYNAIPTRRTTNSYYTNKTCGFIFENIVDTKLNMSTYNEHITKGNITAGNTLTKFSAVCRSVKEIFDMLAEQSGTQWYIDDTKTIHFVQEIAVVTASQSLDVSGAFTSYKIISVDEDLQNYCNRVFTKYSEGVYSAIIDTAEETARALVDGTAYSSGVYGKVIDAGNVDNETALSTIGYNELKKYSHIPQNLRLISYTSVWTAGTQIQVYQPKYGIDANTQFLVEEVNISRYDNNILQYEVGLSRKASANFSTQREEHAKEFFEKLIKKSSTTAAGIETGVTNVIRNYQATNTADLSVSYTAGSTVVTSKTLTTDYKSDIHLTFSAKIAVTAAESLTVTTYIQEAAATATKTFSPVYKLSNEGTISYSEYFEAVSATATVVITTKIATDTGVFTISAGQTDMNLIVFPCSLTSNYTIASIMSQVMDASKGRTLAVSRLNPMAIDTASNTIFVASKWENVKNYWAVYKSTDGGSTWTDTGLPSTTSVYTVAQTAIADVDLHFNAGILHLVGYEHTSVSTSQTEIIFYNYFTPGTALWGYSSNLHVTNINTYNDSGELYNQVICLNSGRVNIVTNMYPMFPQNYLTYSDTYGSSWSTYKALGTYNHYSKLLLDSAGSIIHAVFRSDSTSYKTFYNTFSGTAWGTTIETVNPYSASSTDVYHDIAQDSNNTLWCVNTTTVPAPDRTYLSKRTSGGTWGTAAVTYFEENTIYETTLVIDGSNNPVVFYRRANKVRYRKFDVTASAWGTEKDISYLNTTDQYSGLPHPMIKNSKLYLAFNSGTAVSTCATAFYYGSI
jgi:hypothetical protein